MPQAVSVESFLALARKMLTMIDDDDGIELSANLDNQPDQAQKLAAFIFDQECLGRVVMYKWRGVELQLEVQCGTQAQWMFDNPQHAMIS
jgi:hypothetical protein